jgi:predicted enzyme related to lactoylglutathione lyase
VAEQTLVYPTTPQDWAARFEQGLGLSPETGKRLWETDQLPIDALREWMEREFAADPFFADATSRNVRSVVAWVYGDLPEPNWTGRDPGFGPGGPPIIHVEIPVRSLARARDFYSRVLGWRFANDQVDEVGPFAWFMSGQAVGGLLRERAGAHAGDGVLAYCGVEDLDAALAEAVAAGGAVVAETRRAGWGRYALVRDPDGTVLAVCGA